MPVHSQHRPAEEHPRDKVPPHTQLPFPSHVSQLSKSIRLKIAKLYYILYTLHGYIKFKMPEIALEVTNFQFKESNLCGNVLTCPIVYRITAKLENMRPILSSFSQQ